MDLAQLQAQRAQILKEIERRGGKAKAPGFVKQLTDIDAQIRTARPAAGGAGQALGSQAVAQTNEIKDAGSALKAEQTAGMDEAQTNLRINNPDVLGPTGSQKVTQNPDGSVTVNQDLSGNQQKILTGNENLSNRGLDMAFDQLGNSGLGSAFKPETAQRTTTGDMNADRARIENEVFSRLTRDMDQEYGNSKQGKEAELANRGIAYSSDPNSRYQQELTGIDKRYDSVKADARQRAAEIGGTELQRSFGINEQLIANQTSQQQGARNQNLSEVGALSNMGAGLLLPNFQPYQGANYDPANPAALDQAFRQLGLSQQEINLQKKALAQKGGGGGGGGGQAQPVASSPFYTSAPPGL